MFVEKEGVSVSGTMVFSVLTSKQLRDLGLKLELFRGPSHWRSQFAAQELCFTKTFGLDVFRSLKTVAISGGTRPFA